MGDADVPSPPLRLAGRSNRIIIRRLAQHLVDEEHEVASDLQALLPDPVYARLVHHPQAPLQRRGAQHRRRPYLPGDRRLSRVELVGHPEHRPPVVAEPAREPRRRPEVPPVHVEATRSAWPSVQVLVVAPKGEVDAPPVEEMGDDPDAVTAVEAYHYLLPVRRLGEPRHVGELPALVVDARQKSQGDLARHRLDDVILLDDAVTALHEDQVLLGVPAPEPELGVEGV